MLWLKELFEVDKIARFKVKHVVTWEAFEDDEIAWLMVDCIVAWNFGLLQDCIFWNFILCFFSIKSFLCTFKKNIHVITSFVCFNFKTYGYKNYCVFTFVNLNFQEIRQCYLEFFYICNFLPLEFVKIFNIPNCK